MKSRSNRLIRHCMAGLLTLALTLPSGAALTIFGESSIPEEAANTDITETITSAPVSGEIPGGDAAGQTEEPEEAAPVPEKETIAEPDTSEGAEPDIGEPGETESTGRFADIRDHWATGIIEFWLEREIITGYPDGRFLPDNPVTRAEAASLITRIRGLSGSEHQIFQDVSTEHWAFHAIQCCHTFGILKGTGGGCFNPAESITREAAITMICRASSFTPFTEEDVLQSIPDQDQISGWAREAAATLLKAGIITGDEEGLLHPADDVTRAELLTMLYRLETSGLWDPTLQKEYTLSDPEWMITIKDPDQDQHPEIALTASTLGEQTVILPEFTDLHQVRMNYSLAFSPNSAVLFSGNKNITSDPVLDLTKLSSPVQDGVYPLTVSVCIGDQKRDYHFNLVYGTSLDAMFLNSDEQSGRRFFVEKDKGNSVTGTMQMLSCDGKTLYNGDLTQLKSRGNSTFEYAKKPYQIKLDQKADLIGNGEKGKTWVLLANYADPTMLKDKLCKDLAADLQMPGTPDCKWVDLYFDGEYRGVYLLTEKVQISSAGLDITDLEEMYEEVNEDYGSDPQAMISKNKYGSQIQYIEGLISPEDIDNGYLIELNNNQYDEIIGFITRRNTGVNIKYPEYLNQEAVEYISEFYQEFEDAVYAVSKGGRYTGINATTHRSFTRYCDLDSMVRMYLLYQFSMNADAYFGSTYFYMEDGLLHQGPVWDSDLSFGIFWDEVHKPDHALQNPYLSEALEKLPVFQKAVKTVYDDEFRDLAEKYTSEIVSQYEEELSLSESRNHLIWPLYYKIAAFDRAYPKDSSYAEVIEDLQEWMNARIEYMDGKFKNWKK